jgi:hypothetical protein
MNFKKIKMPCEYMPYVTDNAHTFVPGETNIVACVYCKNIYDYKEFYQVYNCLVCEKCGIDAVMFVKRSPLNGISEEKQMVLLEKWHKEGFTKKI